MDLGLSEWDFPFLVFGLFSASFLLGLDFELSTTSLLLLAGTDRAALMTLLPFLDCGLSGNMKPEPRVGLGDRELFEPEDLLALMDKRLAVLWNLFSEAAGTSSNAESLAESKEGTDLLQKLT